MIVTINGERRLVAPGATVASVIEPMSATPQARGIAVALDGVVVARSRWCDTVLTDGARIEVLAAIGGG